MERGSERERERGGGGEGEGRGHGLVIISLNFQSMDHVRLLVFCWLATHMYVL